ncbi:Putative hybrid cluster protein [Giardia duodenalis]|uniref:Putative hybrid cluster protein n=1 Tax=Giardia intestinalis TaxID=5741 RepID=V6TUB6_GIAIN|nr:Putative hybrid cluster protein [Giardia intestinalis]
MGGPGDIEELSKMYCAQCEQTLHPTGCVRAGVCSKTPEAAAIQDAMIYGATLLGNFHLEEDHVLILQSIFATLTNVNFSAVDLRTRFLGPIVARLEALSGTNPSQTVADYLKLSKRILTEPKDDWIKVCRSTLAPDFLTRKYGSTSAGLRYLTLLGMKGLCAYAEHCYKLLSFNKAPLTELHQAMVPATTNLYNALFTDDLTTQDLLSCALGIGKANLSVTSLLDRLHADTLGVPTLCSVPVRMHPGKCVLITGHDMVDMLLLLTAAQEKGVHVYTHGEMFPAYTYPRLRSFSCFKGHFGTAWQNQQKEFPLFPGPIVFTSNCLKPPLPSYRDRVFVMDCVGFDDIKVVEGLDFSEVINCALESTGFESEEHCRSVEGMITTTGLEAEGFHADEIRGAGFNHRVLKKPEILSNLVNLVKTGQITCIQFNGGCDGASKDRSAFSKKALQADQKTLILTNSCGRFRLNRLQDYGEINGIPRLLDTGQCNDFYSLAQILIDLSGALGCSLNDLPLQIYVSWFEQKAIVQFLTFLHLGVKNITLGPSLPLFLTDDILQFLKENYGVTKITAV